MKKIFRGNDALPDLVIGIAIFGIIALIIPIFFVQQKLYYAAGLLIGLCCAVFSACHMAKGISQAVDYDEGTATRRMQKGSAFRYGVELVVLGILMIFNFASPIAAFIGMISLKVSAYLSPFTHKLFRR